MGKTCEPKAFSFQCMTKFTKNKKKLKKKELKINFFLKNVSGHDTRHARSQFTDQESNPRLLQWKRQVLASEPPGKSQHPNNQHTKENNQCRVTNKLSRR